MAYDTVDQRSFTRLSMTVDLLAAEIEKLKVRIIDLEEIAKGAKLPNDQETRTP